MSPVQTYDRSQSYRWNYDNPPEVPNANPQTHAADPFSSQTPGRTAHRFLGLKCHSPLGIAAGPLLNSNWIFHYANLGFDILTYKTVRSRERACYAMPNLLPVECEHIDRPGQVVASPEMHGSWAISFGMPSQSREIWMSDVRRCKSLLPDGKLLTVSVVATPEEDWSIDQIADDYALVASLAVESGADSIEANFSCPNVSSVDGQLFHDADSSKFVAQRIRAVIGNVPLVLKIGQITTLPAAHSLLESTAESIDGLSMINCIPSTVVHHDGTAAFDGAARGIGGSAIRAAVLAQVQLFAPLADQYGVEIIGVGGVSAVKDYTALIDAGASSVQLATAAMLNPGLGQQIKRES